MTGKFLISKEQRMTCHYFQNQMDGSNYSTSIMWDPYCNSASHSTKSHILLASKSLPPRELKAELRATTSLSLEAVPCIKIKSSYPQGYATPRGGPHAVLFVLRIPPPRRSQFGSSSRKWNLGPTILCPVALSRGIRLHRQVLYEHKPSFSLKLST